MSKDILPNLTRNLISGKDLSADEARTAALALADSASDPDDKSKFLVALKHKGESPEEVSSFAATFRELAVASGRRYLP